MITAYDGPEALNKTVKLLKEAVEKLAEDRLRVLLLTECIASLYESHTPLYNFTQFKEFCGGRLHVSLNDAEKRMKENG